jgi:hypothetical protein
VAVSTSYAGIAAPKPSVRPFPNPISRQGRELRFVRDGRDPCGQVIAPGGASLQSRGSDLPAIGVAQKARQSGEVHRHSPGFVLGRAQRPTWRGGRGRRRLAASAAAIHAQSARGRRYRRQELRTNYLHVAEEPHFIIATRLVARREMFRGPSIPFGNDNFPGGISVAVYYRFCSAPSAHASALNLNRSRIGACGVGRYRRRGQVPGGPDRYSLRLCFLFEG